ncbi:NAD+ dependent histone deacetylase [Komagataella phaffii CBS 7435]|uniref:Member of the Sir2 family of NAD(+)-dependent protein deacetylases n=2 Tax=Komagataella phaffii TaxID=460519 RepID=C4R0X1_KOMPG|nr:Member of the Sir2 family of NAD(+)-dependent protein deacetylases [Komagataella phaffii GS115]AOA62172.1 GQ67_00561T0 [Komagataella phaffii]CAH2448333.1 NAD+ dependent histone deacetylase [Komagataella phaffii CBS 7435]AOA67531.1 GQ68_00827T0 [Komagataella phaffii GS115]CAY69145.1 Member of the Sir2 family of NAD(+)-dependent protein deacetylases [Komagataella phaffii GS115]CCA38465.1 NAD+ dependent histone deacetylase [Komagataella phaffii CBS 7435]
MRTLLLDPEDREDKLCLSMINQKVSKSKKMLCLTGAGISCNAGIPDFRSNKGLYNLVKQENKGVKSLNKGQDLFDISLFRQEETIQIFNRFMHSLYEHSRQIQPTDTHLFIKHLYERKKLIRCYTQNIDGLERKLGLVTDNTNELKWKDLQIVQLHGDLHKLSCTNCSNKFSWNLEYETLLHNGESPECPKCLEFYFARLSQGKRLSSINIGILRPNIILYGENNEYSEYLVRGFNQDLNKRPNILLIFGTSLKVNGVQSLVKKIAKNLHEDDSKGIVIYINKTPLNSSWNSIVDFHIQADCDEWVQHLRANFPDLFLTQSQLDLRKNKKKRSIIKEENNCTTGDISLTPPVTPTKVKSENARLTNLKPSDNIQEYISLLDDTDQGELTDEDGENSNLLPSPMNSMNSMTEQNTNIKQETNPITVQSKRIKPTVGSTRRVLKARNIPRRKNKIPQAETIAI